MANQGKTWKNTGKQAESRKSIEKHGKTGRINKKNRKTWQNSGKRRKTRENRENQGKT